MGTEPSINLENDRWAINSDPRGEMSNNFLSVIGILSFHKAVSGGRRLRRLMKMLSGSADESILTPLKPKHNVYLEPGGSETASRIELSPKT